MRPRCERQAKTVILYWRLQGLALIENNLWAERPISTETPAAFCDKPFPNYWSLADISVPMCEAMSGLSIGTLKRAVGWPLPNSSIATILITTHSTASRKRSVNLLGLYWLHVRWGTHRMDFGMCVVHQGHSEFKTIHDFDV